MLIKSRRGWELPESAATPEGVYRNRRRFLKDLAAGPALLAGGGLMGAASFGSSARADEDPTADLYPVERNPRYPLDRELTPEGEATDYINFYEFGSHKKVAPMAQAMSIRPWTVVFDGLVEEERTVDIDTLIRAMPLEERTYRHRCVEAWSMAVPWSGFPMTALVDYVRPLSSAKYVRMETLVDEASMPGLRAFWYPWPYVEGLSMAEATNELAFMATGLYGKPIPKQNGAPIRLVTPWKYGFKCVKSIVRFTFTEERPLNFWQEVQGREYGFWANVNPDVPHPRWSQATERVLGTDERVPTLLYNGYGEFVADLYKHMDGERLFM